MFEPREVAALLQIARDASAGRDFEGRFAAITAALRVVVPSAAVTAIVVDPLLRQGGGRAFFRDLEPADVEAYPRHYLPFDPCPRASAARPGQALTLSDLLPAQRFGEDPYTGDLLGRLGLRHVLGLMVRVPGGGWLSFGLHRERARRDFTRRERAAL